MVYKDEDFSADSSDSNSPTLDALEDEDGTIAQLRARAPEVTVTLVKQDRSRPSLAMPPTPDPPCSQQLRLAHKVTQHSACAIHYTEKEKQPPIHRYQW